MRANPAFEDIFGFNEEEVIGKSFLTYIHPDDVPVFENIFSKLISGESHSTVEYRSKHRSGHYIWMEATATLVIEEGRVL
ncbi:PAS domain-containing protein [Ornithinibacillus halotolerans]|uniref:PAS domain-containing protein n=1 Tax=Ornithinibacillus halotolerans TaxID=1274357 RepID=UPI001E4218B5|nr:PAS domain-containing protein [Ornithinibacillus halotolerans]